jgi:hypothetical protein
MEIDYNKLTNDIQYRPELKSGQSLSEYLMNEIGLNTNDFNIDINPFTKSINAKIFFDENTFLNIKISKSNSCLELKCKI